MGRLETTPLPAECSAHFLTNCPTCDLQVIAARGRRSSGFGEYRRTLPRTRKDRHVPLETEEVERRALRRVPARPSAEELVDRWEHDGTLARDLRAERTLEVAMKPLDPLQAGPARETETSSRPWLRFD